jgi:hypothetical protein
MAAQLERFQADYQSILAALADFFEKRKMTEYGFKINEFSVFASFLVTSAFLRKNDVQVTSPALEEFHKSIIILIVDRIIADSDREFPQDEIDKLTVSIQEIMMSRYGEYAGIIRAASDLSDKAASFVLLIDAFLSHGLAQPPDGHDSIRLELGRCLLAAMKNQT